MIHKLHDRILSMSSPICITYFSENQQATAEAFADQYHLPCLAVENAVTDLRLNFGSDYVELKDSHNNSAIHVDFVSGALAHRRKYGGGKGQAIARAIGFKQGGTPPHILDATAGLAKDAFVLACLGCPVTMLERSPVVAKLVADAIQRASEDAVFKPVLEQGFQLIQANAIDHMLSINDARRPEVIYLDPMYPEKKKSALVKKNMQLLQKLLGQDDDIEDLLNTALKTAKKRVVVKRPRGASTIASTKPTTQIESKKTRYDVYVINALAGTK
ncbi:MAG: class I SAM-dependent methyltransferase [Gammaproteobacteria bacterium]|nr:class I SAM-dependent methyltransferase [Gammaproteobacteria bacterium]